MASSSSHTLDGHISIAAPQGGNFKLCAVDCLFTDEHRASSRFILSIFNVPQSGVTVTLHSEMVAVLTSTGQTILPNNQTSIVRNDTSYKMSNSCYVETTNAVTLYGTYWTYKDGISYRVPSFVVRY